MIVDGIKMEHYRKQAQYSEGVSFPTHKHADQGRTRERAQKRRLGGGSHSRPARRRGRQGGVGETLENVGAVGTQKGSYGSKDLW